MRILSWLKSFFRRKREQPEKTTWLSTNDIDFQSNRLYRDYMARRKSRRIEVVEPEEPGSDFFIGGTWRNTMPDRGGDRAIVGAGAHPEYRQKRG
jgi:hypothetical protein